MGASTSEQRELIREIRRDDSRTSFILMLLWSCDRHHKTGAGRVSAEFEQRSALHQPSSCFR